MSPRFGLPPWFVENDAARRWWPRQVLGTFVRTFNPFRFWSALEMSHPLRWRRMLVHAIVLAGVLYACFALAVGIAAWREWRVAARQAVPSTTGMAVFAQAAALPLSPRSNGMHTHPRQGRAWPYTPPIWHAAALLLGTWQIGMLVLVGHLAAGLSFAALPVSRRRARVRTRHVVRVSLYGIGLVVPALAAVLFAEATPRSPTLVGDILWRLFGGAAEVLLPAVLPLELAWWTLATSRYLKIPHALGVGLAAVTIGGLVGSAAVLYLTVARF
jgi:hypothetical protein